jgi:hypothetical protein
MRSRTCVMVILVWMVSAVIACGTGRQQQRSAQGDARKAEGITRAETKEAIAESAYRTLSQIDEYEVDAATYERFRRYEWPSFTILHMDVRSGPIRKADAVVVLGVAGGEATSPGSAESLVDAVLEQSDDRGLCIVRGWLEGQRHVVALPTECPAEIRDELDGILHDFDDLTGGEAVWVLRFGQGLLRSKQRL